MLHDELLKLLVDPKSKEPLRRATDAEIARVNATIDKGVKNQGGQPVKDKLTEALVAEKGKRVYPVRDNIPVLLFDESIALE
ncbi:MAG: Trm112 family protein [Planctomycetota bacterium]